MVVILQHTTAAYTAVVCPLGDEHGVLALNNDVLPHLGFGSSTLGTSARRCRGYV
jgi:hypothetical protein